MTSLRTRYGSAHRNCMQRETWVNVFATLEGDDEVIVGVEASPERLLRRFALVSVRDS
jgi:hypothetical protein